MTGRRLYELLCDEHQKRGEHWRNPDRSMNRLDLPTDLVAWQFLADGERYMFNRIAERLKGVKR